MYRVAYILVTDPASKKYQQLQTQQQGEESPAHFLLRRNNSGAIATTHENASEQNELEAEEEENEKGEEEEKQEAEPQHRVAGLSCKAFEGGPDDDVAQEMVYWRDVPSDAQFVSPFHDTTEERYLTFEPDIGGFNNIRIAMEVAVSLALAMGRTLVLPPSQQIHHLFHGGEESKQMRLQDFYHFESISKEHEEAGGKFKFITFQEFLETVAMKGQLKDGDTGNVTFPPFNQTNWDGILYNAMSSLDGPGKTLWRWMHQATTAITTKHFRCMIAFSAHSNDLNATERLNSFVERIFLQDRERYPNLTSSHRWFYRFSSFNGNPLPINASAPDRLAQVLADRTSLCVYGKKEQEAKVIHLKGEPYSGERVLFPFYTLLFFEDYHHDLWMKRFVRDHLRYSDNIQCAAARVVAAVRNDARKHGETTGSFDSIHVRRGDFDTLFAEGKLPAEEIYHNNTRLMLRDGRTLFVATDEKDTSFFDPLRAHYNLKFLNDYMHLLTDIHPNYYGMVDQLVASRADTFVGTYQSTFSAYINRLRGYHVQKTRSPGYKHGIIDSYYYAPDNLAYLRTIMRLYYGARPEYWKQEFADGWRDIDFDVNDDILSR